MDTLAALGKLLRMDGHTVHLADGYQSALDVAKKEQLDLAVCDISLWDGDGCDLLGDLKKLQPVNAIAVTGYTLEDEVEHYLQAGFAAVLPKPLQHSRLTSVISKLSSQGPDRPV